MNSFPRLNEVKGLTAPCFTSLSHPRFSCSLQQSIWTVKCVSAFFFLCVCIYLRQLSKPYIPLPYCSPNVKKLFPMCLTRREKMTQQNHMRSQFPMQLFRKRKPTHKKAFSRIMSATVSVTRVPLLVLT